MKTAIIIPARLNSSRLPRKLLLNKTGKPLIQHSWERACLVKGVDQVLVATDDEAIFEVVQKFGGTAIMTDKHHTSGSARIAQAAQSIDADIVINLQGDEPEINPETVADLIALQKTTDSLASTVACPFPENKKTGPGSPDDPAAVKVVLCAAKPENTANALYFSRAKIPHTDQNAYLMHIGIYAFSYAGLQKFANHSPTPLEQAESLEQLRILEMGEKISVLRSPSANPGIDTQADYDAFVARISK